MHRTRLIAYSCSQINENAQQLPNRRPAKPKEMFLFASAHNTLASLCELSLNACTSAQVERSRFAAVGHACAPG